MLSQEFIDEMKSKLLEEKDRLTNELNDMPVHTEVGEDYDENATEIQADEAARNIHQRISTDLSKIDQALSKIEQGTYGTDEDGNEIGEARLRAIPWADKAI